MLKMCVLNLSIFCDTLKPGLELPAKRLPKSAAKNTKQLLFIKYWLYSRIDGVKSFVYTVSLILATTLWGKLYYAHFTDWQWYACAGYWAYC